MYIENGDTLVVKSGIEFYEKERSGLKPNTVRDKERAIDDGLKDGMLYFVQKIKVINTMKPECSFIRIISDISYWKDLIIISWEHSNGIN